MTLKEMREQARRAFEDNNRVRGTEDTLDFSYLETSHNAGVTHKHSWDPSPVAEPTKEEILRNREIERRKNSTDS